MNNNDVSHCDHDVYRKRRGGRERAGNVEYHRIAIVSLVTGLGSPFGQPLRLDATFMKEIYNSLLLALAEHFIHLLISNAANIVALNNTS